MPATVHSDGEAVQATGADYSNTNGTETVSDIHKRANGVNGINGTHLTNGVNGTHLTNGVNGTHDMDGPHSQHIPNARAGTWPVNTHLPRPSSRSSSNGTVNGNPAGSVISDHHDSYEHEAGGPRSRAFAHIQTWADDPKITSFPRISKPMELMRHAYDVVVIGSGYGGGVAASRMSRAGKRVCVLERGKERWPGEFPTSKGDAFDQLHYSGQIVPPWLPKKVVHGGDPTGMYHLIFGNGQNAVVGNGK